LIDGMPKQRAEPS